MAATIDLPTIRATLRRVMERKGVKPTTLSLRIGTNKRIVKDLLEKGSDINVSTLIRISGALDVPLSELFAAPRVPVVGIIETGGTIIFQDNQERETVVGLPGADGDLVALCVSGDSMRPKYNDGDIIYIQGSPAGIASDAIGEDCAVRLVSGETYIKQLIKGSEVGRFTLISLNAPPIENVEVVWATRVIFIMPALSRRFFS